MDKEKKNLLVFGYGLSLLLPYFVALHGLKDALDFPSFVLVLLAGFGFVLWIVTRVARLKFWMNVWILFVQATLLFQQFSGEGRISAIIFLCLSVVFFCVTIIRVEVLRSFYRVWMSVTGFIGRIVSALILNAVFFLIFAPIGFFFRFTDRDHLDRKIDKNAPTYWIPRSEGLSPKERYQKQF
ncbi:MAG: hypothetical protein HQL21_06165 [Candidatus Omnitrophica bacterium]|nr:hypothetical protein [Candidatus Omnitrophota bacterium]